LEREFVKLDYDGSGTIEPEEVIRFLVEENGLGEEEAA